MEHLGASRSDGFPLPVGTGCHVTDALGDGASNVHFYLFYPFFLSFLFWQRNFSMSVNSAAVLRLTGRGGGGTVVGAPRGRSSSRGRGELPCEKSVMEEVEKEDREITLKIFWYFDF